MKRIRATVILLVGMSGVVIGCGPANPPTACGSGRPEPVAAQADGRDSVVAAYFPAEGQEYVVRVVGLQGESIPNVRVEVFRADLTRADLLPDATCMRLARLFESKNLVTNSEGECRFPDLGETGVPSRYFIKLSPPPPYVASTLQLHYGLAGLCVSLPVGRTIKGVVSEPDGTPVPSVRVIAGRNSVDVLGGVTVPEQWLEPCPQGTTAADGSFVLQGVGRKACRISVNQTGNERPGERIAENWLDISAHETGPLKLVLRGRTLCREN